MGFYDAWKSEAHVQLFDIWSRAPLFVLRERYERFNEVKLLNASIDGHKQSFAMLEVGCATGEFYRYFASRHPKASYIGCDISGAAIKRAQEKYKAPDRFMQTDKELSGVAERKPDVVFCRDVILHQTDPFVFLRRLYDLAQRLLILRLRTRDVGVTEKDPEKSCQLNYGVWAPYIVINSMELLNTVKGFTPRPKVVRLTKHYMVLGGQHARYLPKDCYFKETGTAESALLIEKGPGAGDIEVVEETAPEDLRLGLTAGIVSWLSRH